MFALIGAIVAGIETFHDSHADTAHPNASDAAAFSRPSPPPGSNPRARPAKRGLDLTGDLQVRNSPSNGRLVPALETRAGNGAPGLVGLRPPGAARCPVVSARLGLHWPYSPYPENSAAAIEAAHRAGAPKVEIDVGFSHDGVPVVLHDATVDRVTTHRGSVTSYTAVQLESFPLKVGDRRMSDQHVLSLWDALSRIKADGMRVSVEIKPDVLAPGQARTIAVRLARLNYWHMLDVRSFDPPVLAMMRRADRRIHTTLIVRSPVVPAPPGNVMESIDYDWRGSTLRPGVVRALHAEGLQVDAFTPDTKAGFAAVPHTVDQITTNNVQGARAFLKARGC